MCFPDHHLKREFKAKRASKRLKGALVIQNAFRFWRSTNKKLRLARVAVCKIVARKTWSQMMGLAMGAHMRLVRSHFDEEIR